MSRRYVKASKFDDLNKVKVETVAVVSAKDNLQSVTESQTYFKRNYLDAIKKIIPSFYFYDEQQLSGTQISYPNQLINSHVLANKKQSTIFPVSSLVDDTYLSSINTPSGFCKYFIKQQSPAQITTDDFQRNILFPLGKSFSNFSTSGEFINYISGTFLPSIPSIHTGHHATDDLATLTASAYANDSSGTYKYLANNLGWVYFLNRTGSPGGFDPSTGLATLMTKTLWKGKSIVLEDSINIYQEHLWRNEGDFNVTETIIPVNYVSSLSISANTWTSGTQLLDRLKTLNQVIYSPHFLDSPDNKVGETFSTYFATCSIDQEGTLITDTEEAGPLSRFLEAMSFSIADRLTEQGEIGVLYDIGKCPDEFLELLGELIGWRFLGDDVDKWRVQLRNAVSIYKMKGTRRSIQYLLDTLFSTGGFNVTTSSQLSELWESYVPDLMYYALATSSSAFTNFETYTPELAEQFGITSYDPLDMPTNIKLVVDKILFDLVREFPDQFILGGKPFPKVELVTSGNVPWLGPYNVSSDAKTGPHYMTGDRYTENSEDLTLVYDPNFVFYYRDRPYLVPPYEKRQYYTQTRVTTSMIERIGYYLTCYGVDKKFANDVQRFITQELNTKMDVTKVINNFLIFTKERKYPTNYDDIIRDVTKQRLIDPVSLLSLWNGKSSHFIMTFDASSFDWTPQARISTNYYGVQKVWRALDQVVPAHAIANVLLTVSDVTDAMTAISDLACKEVRPNFYDLYEGSANVTTNYGTSCVDMATLAIAAGLTPNRFKRGNVDSLDDSLLSGTTFTQAPRNTLRRRNFHNLLPETKMFTRLGRNNPGSLELSTSYYSSSIGYLPLGYMYSSLDFKEVALRNNDWGEGIGQLIDYPNFHPVWDICQNLSSPSSIFGCDVSNTFASRAKQSVASSACNTYGRRGQLPEIIYTMTKVHDQEKYLQASSMVSGYLDEYGYINSLWPTGSNLISPVNFSSWYAAHAEYGGIDISQSIGNYLINKESADKSLNYYEHFTFGQKVNKLYNDYANSATYNGHGTVNNYNLLGVPNIFSHTFGPLIYNYDFNVDGSALEASGYVAASSLIGEVDIAYYGGSGILSPSGASASVYELGTYAASDASDVFLARPEFRNNNLVSSIELVDTSVPYTFSAHPIFSIFDLSRDDQTKYSYNKYLINNQIIKYHRSESSDLFPRIRIKIDNSDTTNVARNFLEPDHEYEVRVKAHNLDISSTDIGGLTLGLWIHTEPEDNKVWTYKADKGYSGKDAGNWKQQQLLNLSGSNGINESNRFIQKIPFKRGQLDTMLGAGEGLYKPQYQDIYDYRCWEPLTETVLLGANPQAVANVGEVSQEEIVFKFSTKNNETIKSANLGVTRDINNQYLADFGKIHRLDQKYVLELFVIKGHPTKFVVFEDITIKDITNYNKAVIQTKYGNVQLDVQDLKAVFRYFKSLSTGVASRNYTGTSSVMETSGGSRLNYRTNTAMYDDTVRGANYGELSYLNISGN